LDILQQLGLALGFAALSGINLYLTTLVAGLAVRFNWINLATEYEQMQVLGSWWVIGVAAALFLVEFFADKIPWVDSTWDVVHTVVRPAGAIFLALAALGDLDPTATVVAGLLAGGASLATHAAKAGGRLLINLSPEPVSNSVASVGEDGLVLGGLALMGISPAVAFFVFLVVVIVAVVIASRCWGAIRKGLRVLKAKVFRRKLAAEGVKEEML
jgi:hypothetical protein